MIIWTVYDHPRDFPAHWIARPFFTGRGWSAPLAYHVLGRSLAEVRAKLEPMGLVCIARQAGDDPTIVESWL